MSRFRDETIIAVATPPGRGAISLIRLSGSEASTLVRGQLRLGRGAEYRHRRPCLATFVDSASRPLDQVLVTLFPAPTSYTGEEVVEISCHGSPPVVQEILETLLRSGARLAEPGEFTLRAFLNQKMDLAQAEGVRDLIESQTVFQARVARDQVEGRLSAELRPYQDDLIRVISHMETSVEFVEDEAEPEDRAQLVERMLEIDRGFGRLLGSFELGRVVRDGFCVSIVGRPNAGKSSLFNALVQQERVIVTDVPGTTRDAVAETVDLEGIPTQLVDTAGIREVEDPVESLGVRKSLEYIGRSDVTLFVVDGSTEFGREDALVWAGIKERPCILVLNKLDLSRLAEVPPDIGQQCESVVAVSALNGTCVGELRRAMSRVLTPVKGWERERVLITNVRHKNCLERAREHLSGAFAACEEGLSEEFPLYDLRKALDETGKITGETSVEDILGEIFSTFCIGK